MSRRLMFPGFLCSALTVWSGTDWPEFRGPSGQGNATAPNLPLEWSETRNIAWKQEIPGAGWSSPVIQGRRVYLTTSVGPADGGDSAKSLRALCLDTATGAIQWNSAVFRLDSGSPPRIHNKNSHASPTPLVAGERLYVHFGNQGTACLDLHGQVLWRNTSLGYSPVHGSGGSPVLAGDALIVSCDGASEPFIVALDKDTGKVLWRSKRETSAKKKFSFSTPLVVAVNGTMQVISPGSGVVCSLDPKTGREIWRVRYGEGYSVVPRPVYGHGLLFIGTGFDSPTVVAIRPDGHG